MSCGARNQALNHSATDAYLCFNPFRDHVLFVPFHDLVQPPVLYGRHVRGDISMHAGGQILESGDPCISVDSINNILLITASINAASDVVLLVLPISCVWNLHMEWRKKLGVSAVFATATL